MNLYTFCNKKYTGKRFIRFIFAFRFIIIRINMRIKTISRYLLMGSFLIAIPVGNSHAQSALKKSATEMRSVSNGKTNIWKLDITVAADGSGDYATFYDAMEHIRALMDYKVTVHIKRGIYREKVIVPAWLKNVEFVGEDAKGTVITFGDNANMDKMGTFRTYTMRVDGSDITFRNLTIENNASQTGQAVALHTEGDRLRFFNCRFLGNTDTVYGGREGGRLYFSKCYIEGTTDFIFGSSIAFFDNCEIHSKRNTYMTAASTPAAYKFGFIFSNCHLTAEPGINRVYLGRPWRPYASVAFINCRMDKHIRPEGWDNWRDPKNERTARYVEYGSAGEGSDSSQRVKWSRQLTKKQAEAYTDIRAVFSQNTPWNPFDK